MEKKTIQLSDFTFIEPALPIVHLTPPLNQQLVMVTFAIAILQFLLRLGCLGEYGFHQDELLYLALSDHLAWGYREVPPFIALMGAMSKTLLGDTVSAVRIIPSICAGLIVIFTGFITIRLKGKLFAVFISCVAVAFSPAFLATGALFIPQVFDQLCWVISTYLFILVLQTHNRNLLLYLGIAAGIGILIKYTYLLYIIGLLIGIAIRPSSRSIFKDSYFWLGTGIALVIIFPHFLWQYQNHFPAIRHYRELNATQLIYLTRSDFLIHQLVVNGTGILVWLAGAALLFYKKFENYRFLGVAALFVMIIILSLNGKPYYAFGCFPPLFALGGIAIERLFRKTTLALKSAFVLALALPNLMLSIIVLPYLPIEKAAKVFEWTFTHLGIHYPLKWEDQKIHNMNQNYADMIGWEELAQKTARVYRSLSAEEQKHTIVLAEKYGEAGAIDYYQDTYKLPQVISFCSSYALWAPPVLNAKNIIYISTTEPPKFTSSQKMDEIKNPYSRVLGLPIYLIKDVQPATKSWYKKQWKTVNEVKSIPTPKSILAYN
ncbi:MAG: glycosyltransferase family 39 protein [Chitinophagaceae bacterium]|nr:MAG: glycosyltransferase family 39 protein [Chitinophagaceae bacterium]